jgi:hypothetical protein
LKEIKKHIPKAAITFKPDPKAMAVLTSLPERLDDQEARTEWGWSIRYGLKEMVEDFIEEFKK